MLRNGEPVRYREVIETGPCGWYKNAMLAVDIETSGEHAENIRCVGWAEFADVGHVWRYNADTRDAIAELLASDNPKVFHNGQFDVTVLERHGFTVRNWTDDTMLLWHVVEPLLAGKKKEKGDQTQKSLRFLASLLLDEPWWKNYGFESEEDQLRLCARDARVTWACWAKLKERLT
jgi:DNA polymerase I-like protein with 3'-5' exonuclease and polymerase domains